MKLDIVLNYGDTSCVLSDEVSVCLAEWFSASCL